MDKWTRNFIANGPSKEFQEVLHILRGRTSLEKWARRHTDGMFGAIFGLRQAEEFLQFESVLAKGLTKREMETYRDFCAAAVLSQETRIPPLYLLFRQWSLEHMRAYVDRLESDSRWSWIREEWSRGIAAVRLTNITELEDLDEPSKLILHEAARHGGRVQTSVIPSQRRIPPLMTAPLSDCVVYALEDLKSTELAAFLKASQLHQSGAKADRIARILDKVPTDEIAERLHIEPGSYLHLGNTAEERTTWSETIRFLSNLSGAVSGLPIHAQSFSSQTGTRARMGRSFEPHEEMSSPYKQRLQARSA